jgi:hypothetical protein
MESKMVKIINFAVFLSLLAPSILLAETFFSINDLSYEGATRFPVGTYGDSRMGFAQGTFEVSEDQSSIFVVGHGQHQAIAEFSLPAFSNASTIPQLAMAENKQPFRRFLDRVPSGNPDAINTITSLRLINDKILVNALQAYDGDANNTDTTFLIEDPGHLDSSPVTGFIKLQARAHATGWITPIPANLQSAFKGDYLFGHASNFSINGRSSMGPSAFGVSINSVVNAEQGVMVPTYPLLDYSIDNPLAMDLYNKTGENNLWTEVSEAYVGFIVPGTDTYAVFGASGGHEFGLDYKITQDTGKLCGGPCPYIASDVYNYYWFFDVKDMLKVANGQLLAHEVRPYEYGEFQVPFENINNTHNKIIGANFNEVTGTLFFMLGGADKLQNEYESLPLLMAYSVKIANRPEPPTSFRIE